MTCPHCGARLTMYEHYIDYYDNDTIILTEHYECQECHEDIPNSERIATYSLEREVWTQDDRVSEV